MQGIAASKNAAPRRGAIVRFFIVFRKCTCRLIAWLAACSERARQRRILASLPDHGLRDLGLTRDEVESEICKRCWRL